MRDKKIIIGVTGGIAAYKAAELVRILVKEGAKTQVAMTANATNFVAPLTFEALSEDRVVYDMFDRETQPVAHITWGQEADLIIVAPATANFISKMANGMADDFLSTMVLASTARILVCPSMNSQMLLNPVVQDNLKNIAENGCVVMKPGEGELACHTEGPGRLPEPEEIAEQARIILSEQDLSGLKILITAGPTIEFIDPVRYITNRSSGKMGYAMARAAARRGASVTLVSGPTSLNTPVGVTFHGVSTTEEMKKEVLKHSQQSDIIVKAAAPLDYRPKATARHKIKKLEEVETLAMVRTPDILTELGKVKGDSNYILVGFAAETEDLLENAAEKLLKKDLDIIVANDVSQEHAGFESDTNLVKIIYRDGHREDLPLMSKDDVANQLLDRIKTLSERVA
ncbi:bifunctional phosphopantothenoylcysteine decarboxylase/phosphopantothenate--cysteine ligase CoaBC [Thermodesulfobacteriota bacterium]